MMRQLRNLLMSIILNMRIVTRKEMCIRDRGENVIVDLKPSEPLPDNCSIIAIGKNKDLNASREELR